MSDQFNDGWKACRYITAATPCWGDLRPFVHYDADGGVDDEWHACEGHQDMHLTGIYLVEPCLDDGERVTDLSRITLTQEQFDSLLTILSAVDSDETRKAIDRLRKIWDIQHRKMHE